MKNRFFVRAAAAGAILFLILTLIAALRLRADDVASVKSAKAADEYPRETVKTSGGCELSLPAARGRAATVLVCMSVECPISNEFLAAINDVADKYRSRGINLIGINPNAGETLAAMADYARKHKLSFPFAKDDGGKVSRQLLFNVTPEAVVFDPAGKIVYRGRIDDRYRSGGGQSGAKITPDLVRALDEVIAGKPVSVARTKPVGCPIQLSPPATGPK